MQGILSTDIFASLLEDDFASFSLKIGYRRALLKWWRDLQDLQDPNSTKSERAQGRDPQEESVHRDVSVLSCCDTRPNTASSPATGGEERPNSSVVASPLSECKHHLNEASRLTDEVNLIVNRFTIRPSNGNAEEADKQPEIDTFRKRSNAQVSARPANVPSLRLIQHGKVLGKSLAQPPEDGNLTICEWANGSVWEWGRPSCYATPWSEVKSCPSPGASQYCSVEAQLPLPRSSRGRIAANKSWGARHKLKDAPSRVFGGSRGFRFDQSKGFSFGLGQQVPFTPQMVEWIKNPGPADYQVYTNVLESNRITKTHVTAPCTCARCISISIRLVC